MTELIGCKFNRWTVIASTDSAGCRAFYLCRCNCGTERRVRLDQLQRGKSKSCGCWKAEVASAQIKRLSTTHGMSNKSRTYSVWKGIRRRCNSDDPNYGGRGIKVCEHWNNYANFLADMGEAPKGLSIDRIDNDKNYEPGNCRWTDKVTQMNNMRTNVLIQYKGETLTVKQWARKLNMPYHRLYQRLFKLSWPIKKAFTEDKRVNAYL